MSRNRLATPAVHEVSGSARLTHTTDTSSTATETKQHPQGGFLDTPTAYTTLTQPTAEDLLPETPAGSVVVGVDGSATSRAALRWGTRQAELLGAPLTLCHTHSITGLTGTRRVATGGEDVLEHAVATAAQHIDRARISPVLGYGDPARVLSRVSRGAGMLAIGTHGYFAHGASLFEPLSLRIINGAACPVVVHPLLAGQNGPFAGHVVVGVDGSASSRAALGFAYAHAATHHRPLVAIHVCPDDDAWATSTLLGRVRRNEPLAEALLETELSPYDSMFEGVVTKRAVYTGRAVPGLLRASAGAAILVIGDRGQPGPACTLLGSVAQHMVGNATCPVAVIRSAEPTGG
jgi:nucleotide-binding universal stress UspA family protein